MLKADSRLPLARRSTLNIFLILYVLCVLCGSSVSQQHPASPVKIVSITTEPSHHLVLENEYVRVFDVTVAPHSETEYHQHDRDYLYVTLGDADVQSVRVGEKPVEVKLKDGDVQFVKGGFAHKAVNLGDQPFHNITIELKVPTMLQSCTGECELVSREESKYSKTIKKVLLKEGKGGARVFDAQCHCRDFQLSSPTTLDGPPVEGAKLIVPLVAVERLRPSAKFPAGSVMFFSPGQGGDFVSKKSARWIEIDLGDDSPDRVAPEY